MQTHAWRLSVSKQSLLGPLRIGLRLCALRLPTSRVEPWRRITRPSARNWCANSIVECLIATDTASSGPSSRGSLSAARPFSTTDHRPPRSHHECPTRLQPLPKALMVSRTKLRMRRGSVNCRTRRACRPRSRQSTITQFTRPRHSAARARTPVTQALGTRRRPVITRTVGRRQQRQGWNCRSSTGK